VERRCVVVYGEAVAEYQRPAIASDLEKDVTPEALPALAAAALGAFLAGLLVGMVFNP
jgi:hypothetical protein